MNASAGATALPIDPDRLRALLADSLALWRVEGTVEAGVEPCVAVVRAADGTLIWIERAAAGIPFRWQTRWRAVRDGEGRHREAHPRPCSSLVGVLNAMRLALNVERGSAIRVTAESRPE